MNKRLLICDLDNTLYDWVSFFVPSFYSLVDATVALTNCNREHLLNDFREVHQAHHDSELPFALLETKTIRTLYPNKSRSELADLFDPAFYAFNSTRNATLRLYPNVKESLKTLAENNITLIAHTESNLYAAVGRLRKLEVIDYFKRIYCRERSSFQHPNPKAEIAWESIVQKYKPRELSHHQRKPNVDVLLEICNDERTSPSNAAYVGDSLSRDILMARDAGVMAIWAKYGVAHDTQQYEKLIRITHWTVDDIQRERALKGRAVNIVPDLVLESSFDQLLTAFVRTTAA